MGRRELRDGKAQLLLLAVLLAGDPTGICRQCTLNGRCECANGRSQVMATWNMLDDDDE